MNLQLILGNFALILFVLMVVTGVIWFFDVFYLSRQRRAAADRALADFDARNAKPIEVKIRFSSSIATVNR